MPATPNEPQKPAAIDTPLPHAGLGARSSDLAGVPEEARVYVPKSARLLDRYFGLLMTLVITVLAFLILIALLTNISPNVQPGISPTRNEIINSVNGSGNNSDEDRQGIVGD